MINVSTLIKNMYETFATLQRFILIFSFIIYTDSKKFKAIVIHLKPKNDKYSSKNQKEGSQNQSHIVSADTHQGFIINLVHEHNLIAQPKIYVQIKYSNKDKKFFDEHFRMKISYKIS
jgi:hypothetical protein